MQLGFISLLLTVIVAVVSPSTVSAKQSIPTRASKAHSTFKAHSTSPNAKLTRTHKATQAKSSAYRPQFASVAVDAGTGKILAADDIDGLRHPASLTKVMTLYVLFQDLQAQRIFMTSDLLVTSRAANMAPSKLGLKSGETISVEDAIKALVTKSANDVAATVAENLAGTESAFATRMTSTAHAIGMSKTIFKSASGLPNKDEWTTARDMATLSLRVQRDFPQYYHYFSTLAFNYKGQVIRTHNKLLGQYEGADGIKTGYIATAGFNLTSSAKRGDKRVVGVVLGATSTASRNRYMMQMLDENFPKCMSSDSIAAAAGRTSLVADEFIAVQTGQLAVSAVK